MPNSFSFASLGVSESIQYTIDKLGFVEATPVQAESIPVMLDGQDIRAQAQTGTGKTAAFSLPILQNIELDTQAPQAIIITPTRELAMQVSESIEAMGSHIKALQVVTLYGGQDYRTQLRRLKSGAHIVVGTPGRVLDHLRRGSLKLDSIKTVVLDEADEMLNMGFIDDIETLFNSIPHTHQTALFSATMPKAIKSISKKYLKDPAIIQIEPDHSKAQNIEMFQYRIEKKQKVDMLLRLMMVENIEAAIIFVATKQYCTDLTEILQKQGHSAQAIHGDMKQSQREQVISRLRESQIDVLIATDVAARGLDVARITHVINFDIPSDSETYTHRIGRTGRAGRSGRAFLLATPTEGRTVGFIEKDLGKKIELLEPPSLQEILVKRDDQLLLDVQQKLEHNPRAGMHAKTIEKILAETDCKLYDLATILAGLLVDKSPLNLKPIKTAKLNSSKRASNSNGRRRGDRRGGDRRERRGNDRDRSSGRARNDSFKKKRKAS